MGSKRSLLQRQLDEESSEDDDELEIVAAAAIVNNFVNAKKKHRRKTMKTTDGATKDRAKTEDGARALHVRRGRSGGAGRTASRPGIRSDAERVSIRAQPRRIPSWKNIASPIPIY